MRPALFSYVFLTYIVAVYGATLNERCTKNSDCDVPNSLCKVVTPSCGAGICACLPGFTMHGNECRRAVFLDGRCDPTQDKCVGENVECSHDHKKCVCIYGYKRGLRETDCVPSLMDKSAGESCYDTSQCYYSLVCIDNVCGCYNGFKPAGDYRCTPREVYDSCKSPEDCQATLNTLCLNGGCACAAGYKTVQYMSNKTAEFRNACIANAENMVDEGQPCSYDAAKPVYCKPPFICTSCGDRYLCARRTIFSLETS